VTAKEKLLQRAPPLERGAGRARSPCRWNRGSRRRLGRPLTAAWGEQCRDHAAAGRGGTGGGARALV